MTKSLEAIEGNRFGKLYRDYASLSDLQFIRMNGQHSSLIQDYTELVLGYNSLETNKNRCYILVCRILTTQ